MKVSSLFITVMMFFLFYWTSFVFAQAPLIYEYTSPRPGAQLVSAETTIAIRQGELINEASLQEGLIEVVGTQSGPHTGQLILADDNKTAIFDPDQPFSPGETVAVTLHQGLETVSGQVLDSLSFEFVVSPKEIGVQLRQAVDCCESSMFHFTGADAPLDNKTLYLPSDYATLPDDFPTITVTVAADGTDDGYLFLGALPLNDLVSTRYLMILDNTGEPVYYKPIPANGRIDAVDFKKQPNGQLTYWDQASKAYLVMDSSYTVVDSYQVGNGYETDSHELKILPGGYALLMSYDPQPVDMSQIVAGGVPTATVVGLIIQELDPSRNVIFQWRSWDYIPITDTYQSLTGANIGYVHGNAIELDNDGNLLISSRHLSEITKINRRTGDVMWRLGGKQNEFTFLNTDRVFSHQHDIRRQANGNITLFDNGVGLAPQYSRAVEYELDEVNKIATQVWEYRNVPDTFSFAAGSMQRLPNGNSLIGWGIEGPTSHNPLTLTEVKPDGSKAFELEWSAPNISYRVFRFPWEGHPTSPPTLVVKTGNLTTTLHYSWNGATNIASYRVYGGPTPNPTTLIDERPKAGFETKTVITSPLGSVYYFKVMPVDDQGNETQYSNEVQISRLYLPLVARPGASRSAR